MIEGDTRYSDALIAIEDAQRVLVEYRDNVEVQRTLGMAHWTAGLKARKEAIETARKALRDLPRAEPQSSEKLMTWEEFDLDSSRRFYARCIAEVVVFSKTNGERLFMRWQGSEERFAVPAVAPPTSMVPAQPNHALASLSLSVEEATR